MKFFGWMQSKINGGQGLHSRTATSATHHMKQLEPQKENDWPRGFLAIGTFGNNDDLPRDQDEEIKDTSPDLSEFTPEEIEKLQKELKKLLSKKPHVAAAANYEQAGKTTTTNYHDLPLDRFLNCPSSLEVDRRLLSTTTTSINPDDDKEEIDRTIRVILGRCKDMIICKENMRKKSISFILKKIMFVCSSGLPPSPMPPGLHDRFPESRMERLLRAMLKNKINSQNSSRPSSAKKLIDNPRQSFKKGKGKLTTENDDEDASGGSKWVKTDSEYIVLEI